MQNVELLFQAKNIEFPSNREREKFLRKLKILALPVGTTIYVDPLEFKNSLNLYFEKQKKIRRQRSENGKKTAAKKRNQKESKLEELLLVDNFLKRKL